MVVVWLAIAALVVDIYHGAEFLIVRLFGVVLLFTFAAIIALVLTPVIDRIERMWPFKNRRGLAVAGLYVVALAAVAGVVALFAPSVVDQAKQLPALANRLQAELDSRGINFQLTTLRQGTGTLDVGAAFSIVSALVSVVTSLVLVVVISMYLLVEGRTLVATLRNLFPTHTRKFDFTALAVGSTIASYARGQVIMSFLIGVYTGVVMSALGVPYGYLLGVAAFFLEFIPVVGAVVSMVLATGVGLLQSPRLAVLAFVAGIVGHALDAYVVGPRVMGRVTRLHPLVALAAVVAGGEVAGILGALFAVPLAAVLNIFLGAFYRSSRGDEALSTARHGAVTEAALPRLGEEIGVVEAEGVVGEPVPHTPAKRVTSERSRASRPRRPERTPSGNRPLPP